MIAALERIVVGTTRPDLTFILDVPAELGLARAAERRGSRGEGVDRFEAEAAAFHAALRAAFLAIAEAEPERCIVIDGSRDPAEVEDRIWQAMVRHCFDEDDTDVEAARLLANG